MGRLSALSAPSRSLWVQLRQCCPSIAHTQSSAWPCMGTNVILIPSRYRVTPPPLVPNHLLPSPSTPMAKTYSLARPSLRVKVCLGSRVVRSTSCTPTEVPTQRLLAARSTARERTNTSSPTPKDSTTRYGNALASAGFTASRPPGSAEPQPPLSKAASSATVQLIPRIEITAEFLNRPRHRRYLFPRADLDKRASCPCRG